MTKCVECPVATGPCVGERVGHFCGLARRRPDYHPVIRQYSLSRMPSAIALADPLGEWSYVTREMLASDTRTLIAHLPADVDLVAAIPRSGFLMGADIATARHVPLVAVSRQKGVVEFGHGGRMDGYMPASFRHVVVVDDTAAHGREMAACGPIVAGAFPGAKVTRAVAYCHPQATGGVDLFVRSYPGLHFLDWNWFAAGHGQGCGFDFDGILCRDFTLAECATPESYRAAMATISPLYLPRRTPVPLVVTARPESTREITMAWLARHGVRVERLVMRDWDGPHDIARIAAFKARHYAESGLDLFAESEPAQAREIHRLTGRAVLCPSLPEILAPAKILSLQAAIEPDPEDRRERAMACDHRGEPVRKGCVRFHCKMKKQVVTISDCVTCPMTLEPA